MDFSSDAMFWPRFILTLIAFVFFIVVYRLILRVFKNIGVKGKQMDRSNRWGASSKSTAGGLGFMLAFLVGWLGKDLPHFHFQPSDWMLLAGGAVAFSTGLWDDLRRLSPLPKMLGQLIAGILLVASGLDPVCDQPILNALIQLVLIVGMMNSINMLDNMDGVATIAALAVCVWFIGSTDALPAIVMSGCLFAFLIYNRHPSVMFMGDSGSLLLGYVMATFFLRNGVPGEAVFAGFYPSTLILVLALFALPLADSLVVFINRISHGISPMRGGRDHSTHNLVYAGFSEQSVTVLFILIAAAEVGAAGWFSHFRQEDPSVHLTWLMVLPTLVLFGMLFLVLWILSRYNLRRGKYSYSK